MELLIKLEHTIFFIILAFTVIPALKFLYLIKDLYKSIIKCKNNLSRWNENKVNLEDLNNLSPKEFKHWCKDFLKYKLPKGEVTPIILSYNNINTINENYCKKLLGIMLHNKVNKGIIITTGNYDNSAINFIKKIPKIYNIDLIDGSDLIKEYNVLYSNRFKVETT